MDGTKLDNGYVVGSRFVEDWDYRPCENPVSDEEFIHDLVNNLGMSEKDARAWVKKARPRPRKA